MASLDFDQRRVIPVKINGVWQDELELRAFTKTDDTVFGHGNLVIANDRLDNRTTHFEHRGAVHSRQLKKRLGRESDRSDKSY